MIKRGVWTQDWSNQSGHDLNTLHARLLNLMPAQAMPSASLVAIKTSRVCKFGLALLGKSRHAFLLVVLWLHHISQSAMLRSKDTL